MKGIILYRSKYGATKRYADWLAQETGFDCMETSKANIDDIKNYDAIILGGGIYASGIAGIGFLKKNMNKLQGWRKCYNDCKDFINSCFACYDNTGMFTVRYSCIKV